MNVFHVKHLHMSGSNVALTAITPLGSASEIFPGKIPLGGVGRVAQHNDPQGKGAQSVLFPLVLLFLVGFVIVGGRVL